MASSATVKPRGLTKPAKSESEAALSAAAPLSSWMVISVSDQFAMRTTRGPAVAPLVDRAWPYRLLLVAVAVSADPSARM
jgi:hypothetical protein